jgi:tRNA uridine 5-carbamoylmethylation protein Kti12
MTKENLSSKQFLLIINGPSCGGKTAVAKTLLDQYASIFNAQSDQIKWLVSDYDPNVHRGIIHEMILELIKVALKNKLSVLKQGASYKPEILIQIAKDFNVPLFIANITAPKEILEKRFLERIEAKKNGARVSNVDPKRFAELNDLYQASKMDSELEFDSSLQSPEEIAFAIAEHVKKNVK